LRWPSSSRFGTLKPEWLPRGQRIIALQEAAAPTAERGQRALTSYRDAARSALPSVVHIYTTQQVRQQRHPLFDDPIFRHFFGERQEGQNRSEIPASAPASSSARMATS
jgi:S1-C subfamily serine protease